MRRRTPKPDNSRAHNGEFLTSMNPKLNAYLKAHCPMAVDGWESRRHLEHEALVETHEEAGCRWWRKGHGIVTTGAWVVSPAQRMTEGDL